MERTATKKATGKNGNVYWKETDVFRIIRDELNSLEAVPYQEEERHMEVDVFPHTTTEMLNFRSIVAVNINSREKFQVLRVYTEESPNEDKHVIIFQSTTEPRVEYTLKIWDGDTFNFEFEYELQE